MAGRTGKGAWLALKNEASCQGACWHKCRGGSSVGWYWLLGHAVKGSQDPLGVVLDPWYSRASNGRKLGINFQQGLDRFIAVSLE